MFGRMRILSIIADTLKRRCCLARTPCSTIFCNPRRRMRVFGKSTLGKSTLNVRRMLGNGLSNGGRPSQKDRARQMGARGRRKSRWISRRRWLYCESRLRCDWSRRTSRAMRHSSVLSAKPMLSSFYMRFPCLYSLCKLGSYSCYPYPSAYLVLSLHHFPRAVCLVFILYMIVGFCRIHVHSFLRYVTFWTL